MPVTATVVSTASCTDQPVGPGTQPPRPAPVSCIGQHVLTPNDPRESVKGTPLLTKTKAFTIKGKQIATLEYQMIDTLGRPVDLRDCLCVPSGSNSSLSSSSESSEGVCANYIEFRLQEYLSRGCRNNGYTPQITREAVIVDAANGQVSVELTPDDTNVPGVYFGEFALVERPVDDTAQPEVLFSNSFYVHIGRNSWTDGTMYGPPSISEVRMFLRDNDAAESFLLDNVKFDDGEINQAIALTIAEWNESPPPVAFHTTASFPYRYNWLNAIAGYLFRLVAEHQRANNLTYAAGGVSINDMDKAPNYEEAGLRRLLEWRTWMRNKKGQINLEQAYGTLGSDYSWNQ